MIGYPRSPDYCDAGEAGSLDTLKFVHKVRTSMRVSKCIGYQL